MPASPCLPLKFLCDPFPHGILLPPGNSPGTATSIGQAVTGIRLRNLDTVPQEQTWSVSIQQQFPAAISVDISYIGHKGAHLYARWVAGIGSMRFPQAVADAF